MANICSFRGSYGSCAQWIPHGEGLVDTCLTNSIILFVFRF